MNELFTKIEAFVAEVETHAVDAANKGADVLEQAAAWLRAEAAGVNKLQAGNPAKACELRDRLKKCCNCDTGCDSGKKAVTFGPALTLLIQIALQILEKLATPSEATA